MRMASCTSPTLARTRSVQTPRRWTFKDALATADEEPQAFGIVGRMDM